MVLVLVAGACPGRLAHRTQARQVLARSMLAWAVAAGTPWVVVDSQATEPEQEQELELELGREPVMASGMGLGTLALPGLVLVWAWWG